MRKITCPGGCGTTWMVRDGEKPSCRECNAHAREERDKTGRLVRAWNRRGQLVYLAAAAATLEQWHDDEPRRARPTTLAALDPLVLHPGPFGAIP